MRIYKRGRSWYVDYTYKGKRIRKSIGHSKKIAEIALKDIEVKIAKREHLGITEVKKILFRNFAEEYLIYSQANKAYSSYSRDITNLKHLTFAFGHEYLAQITPQMIEAYKVKRLQEVKNASINRELACLSHLFTKAIEWRYAANNPMSHVKKLKEPPPRLRYLEIQEMQRLLENSPEHLKPIIIVALNTGMRKGEIVNLKWENLNFNNKTINIDKTKTNERRIIPMNDLVYQTLFKLSRISDFVFPSKNGMPYQNIRKSFYKALRDAGIENFRFHDLRHTFASHLAMRGYNIQTIRELLGHKDITTTMRYSHLSRSYLRGAVNDIGTIMAQPQKTERETFSKTRIYCDLGSRPTGRTQDSGSWYWGSNPCSPVN